MDPAQILGRWTRPPGVAVADVSVAEGLVPVQSGRPGCVPSQSRPAWLHRANPNNAQIMIYVAQELGFLYTMYYCWCERYSCDFLLPNAVILGVARFRVSLDCR